MEILGTGSYLPERVISNDDLSKIVETNDEWIVSRTGIKQRRISDGETTSQMAAKAALEALNDAGVKPEEVELILLATMTGDEAMPNTACKVQQVINAVNATCLDISAACTGFVFALNTANAYLSSGMYQNALVIGADTVSKVINWSDRGTCVLFGDGAGAAFVKANSEKAYVSMTGSDGAQGDVLQAGKISLSNLLMQGEVSVEPDDYYMTMNGQKVFQFAVRKVPEVVRQVVEKAGVSMDEIDYFLLHQANVRIIASVAKRLGVPVEKMPVNLDKYGNTSAASVAVLLNEVRREGKLKKGSKVVIAGFGGGLTWGASYIEL